MLKLISVICISVVIFITTSFTQSNDDSTLLYSQKSLSSINAISSNTYYPSGIAINYECQTADDFVASGDWSVNQITVSGSHNDPTFVTVDAFNIYFYTNNNNEPDSLVYFAASQPYFETGDIFTIPLANLVELVGGHYWISVQAIVNWNDYPYEGWAWNQVTESYGVEAEYRNPAWGNGNGSCHSWSPIRNCWNDQGTDMYFEIYGTPGGPTKIEELLTSSSTFSLEQNYPNPFNPSTTIKYSVPQSSTVVLKIFNLLGKEIATLINEEKPAGNYEIAFNASNLPSGTYFYQLKAGSYIETKKMILMK